MQQLNLTIQSIVLLIFFTISPFHHFTINRNVSTKKTIHHWKISPYHHYTIYWFHHFNIWKTKKSLHYFTPKPYWHIKIMLPYHHFIISWFHHFGIPPLHYFTILPRCYKCAPMHYIKKKIDIIIIYKRYIECSQYSLQAW